MTTLRSLLVDSRDGEWGKAEPSSERIQMNVIRGTDFPDVRTGGANRVPVRFLEKRHADRKRLKTWDIIIETAGGSPDRPTGRTILITPNVFEKLGPDVTCASFARFLRIDPDLADPAFVFWLLQHHYERRDLLQFHTQHTGVARFQFTVFAENFEFSLPAFGQQRRISGILGAYDELISVNRRRVAVLETIATTLFEEWFVHCRFPGYENFPSVDTPNGPLPLDWSLQRIQEVTAYISRGIPPKYDPSVETLVIGQKCIRDQRLSLSLARRQSKKVPAEKVVIPGDILINSTGVGTLGRVAQAEAVPAGLTVDSHVTIVRPAEAADRDYLGMQLLQMQSVFEHLGAGSTGQTELARGSIQDQVITWPPAELRARFGQIVRPMRELIDQLMIQNHRLAASRDLLLPRLMSGQLSVSAAEQELEAA